MMRALIALRISTATPAYRLNDRGYHTGWEEWAVNFIITLGVLY
jgi:hypothetical protein